MASTPGMVPVRVKTPSGKTAIMYTNPGMRGTPRSRDNAASTSSLGSPNGRSPRNCMQAAPQQQGSLHESLLQVGDAVYRGGELASVVHVDATLDPPSYVVRMARTGHEVSTERECLTKSNDIGGGHGSGSFADAVQQQTHQQMQQLQQMQMMQQMHQMQQMQQVQQMEQMQQVHPEDQKHPDQPIEPKDLEPELRELQEDHIQHVPQEEQPEQQQVPLDQVQMQQMLHMQQLQQLQQMQTAKFGGQGSFADALHMQQQLQHMQLHAQQRQMMQNVQQPAYMDQMTAMQQMQAQEQMQAMQAMHMQGTHMQYAQQMSMSDYSGPGGHVKNHALEAVTEALNRAEIDDLLVQAKGPKGKKQTKAQGSLASLAARLSGDAPESKFDLASRLSGGGQEYAVPSSSYYGDAGSTGSSNYALQAAAAALGGTEVNFALQHAEEALQSLGEKETRPKQQHYASQAASRAFHASSLADSDGYEERMLQQQKQQEHEEQRMQEMQQQQWLEQQQQMQVHMQQQLQQQLDQQLKQQQQEQEPASPGEEDRQNSRPEYMSLLDDDDDDDDELEALAMAEMEEDKVDTSAFKFPQCSTLSDSRGMAASTPTKLHMSQPHPGARAPGAQVSSGRNLGRPPFATRPQLPPVTTKAQRDAIIDAILNDKSTFRSATPRNVTPRGRKQPKMMPGHVSRSKSTSKKFCAYDMVDECTPRHRNSKPATPRGIADEPLRYLRPTKQDTRQTPTLPRLWRQEAFW